jgi:transcriptional regulator with XRE-family HTH domain
MVKQTLEDWQIEDARRLDQLWREKKPEHLTQERFGEEYDMGSQSNVNLYLKGRVSLNLKAVGQFAKALGVKIDDISPTLADQVRDLYKQCDPDRSRDYGVDQRTREYIQQLFEEEAAKQRTKTPPTPDNGKNL